jgi:hypothetical protein
VGDHAGGNARVINDAIAVYFRDATMAVAFAARWCGAVARGASDSILRARDDETAGRIPARPHKTRY